MTVNSQALVIATAQIGKPYRWGYEGPDEYDCSGLVWYAYYHAGLKWQRTTSDVQIREGTPIRQSQLQPGDLVQPHPGHIQMYAGNGRIVEAPRTGLDVRNVPMWGIGSQSRFTRLVRLPVRKLGKHTYPGHYIKYGSTGPAVRLVQVKVGTHIDGIFGPHTLAAVKAYQKRHKLSVDGVVGPRTWRVMYG